MTSAAGEKSTGFEDFTHGVWLAKEMIRALVATVSKTNELKKRSWGVCRERIVTSVLEARLPSAVRASSSSCRGLKRVLTRKSSASLRACS